MTNRLCATCGTHGPPPFRPPPPELSPDLDRRPGEPARSTLAQWLMACDGCGAVAPDLSMLPPDRVEILESEAYLSLSARPPEATPFLRYAMLCTPGDRAGVYLQAAWTADDAGDDDAARHYRREAAAHWGEPDGVDSALRLVDVLRRAGMLATAEEVAAMIAEQAPDERSQAILAYQRARIAAGDTARHLMSSALRPPSHRPHVSQKQTEAKGFWGRLFGG